MYLTAAESYAHLSNTDSARYYLDAIRIRANSSAASSMATGPALLDSIYKERRKELAFEGTRMFDLLRWKKGVNRPDETNPAFKTLSYPNNKAIAPVPTVDVEVSGMSQNPGY
jgi:starch-binding outer membrane protein, SusD/RagB family